MTEEWRDIVGFEGLYEVSSFGRVRSLPRIDAAGRNWRGGLLRSEPNGLGYRNLVLHRGGVKYRRSVHRLVCEAFHGPAPEGKPLTLHGPKGVADNSPGNVYWGDAGENQRDRIRDGTNEHAAKTHCPRNHEYTEENTYRQPSTGHRICRTCRRERQRRKQ